MGDKSKIILLDLNLLWTKHFSEKSFPVMKYQFYQGKLLDGCEVLPRMKVSYIFKDKEETVNLIKDAFDVLIQFFISTENRFFEKDDLVAFLKIKYDDRTAKQLANFVVSTYSGERRVLGGAIEENAFLLEKHTVPRQYKVFGTKYEASFASTLSILSKLLESEDEKVIRYVSKENSVPYIRIGHLMEILDLGSCEIRGGDSPMIFIRLNSPGIVKKDSYDSKYSNVLFDRTQEKHKVSSEIMDYFFTHSYTNEERWNFIEDFFLGENNEELIRKYPGNVIKRVDVIDVLRTKNVQKIDACLIRRGAQETMMYPPRSGTYMPKDHLTIEIEGEYITKTIQGWIDDNPISLHKLISNRVIYVNAGSVYHRLMNVIERDYKEYYTKLLGMRKMLTILGYREPTMADVIMRANPLRFYKWWVSNRSELYIPMKEKIWLLDQVEKLDATCIKRQEREFLSNLRKTKK